MPNRPAKVSGLDDLLHVLNQSVIEIHARIDQAQKQIPLHKILKATALLNFGVIAGNAVVERSVNLAGATQAGSAHASPQLTLGNVAFMWSAYISNPGQVTVKLLNSSGGSLTPAVVKWNLTVVQ